MRRFFCRWSFLLSFSAFSAGGYRLWGLRWAGTFVIDKKGVIRMKHIGPLTPESLDKKIIPLVKELQGA